MMDPNKDRPEHSSRPDLEPELEQDLEAIRSAWPRMEAQEPPELVDLAVLNAARREVAGRRRPLRWLGAFATASIIVLTLTVVIQQDPNPPVARDEPDGLKLDRSTIGETRQRADEAATPSAAPTAAAPAASMAPAAPSVMKMEASEESGSRDRDREKESMALPEQQLEMDASVATEPLEAGPMAEVAEKALEGSPLPATEWIERLLQLRASGQEDRLNEELAEFREAYPDYVLPPELSE